MDTNPIAARSKHLRDAARGLTGARRQRTEQNINSVESQHSAPVARGYWRNIHAQKDHLVNILWRMISTKKVEKTNIHEISVEDDGQLQ